MTTLTSDRNTLSHSKKSLTKMMTILNCWKKLNTQRKYLRGFKPYQLNDIGLSQQQALASAKNPFWH